ncbi:MAG: hypothetical protein Q8S29_15955, partial [Phreatobacter sp.]|nr:hypothetical protein [Phreatobacter sp.]
MSSVSIILSVDLSAPAVTARSDAMAAAGSSHRCGSCRGNRVAFAGDLGVRRANRIGTVAMLPGESDPIQRPRPPNVAAALAALTDLWANLRDIYRDRKMRFYFNALFELLADRAGFEPA